MTEVFVSSFLIISVMTNDRPGLVETLSTIIKNHNGNWLESRMAQLAGKFAGIVRVQVSNNNKEAMEADLLALRTQGWVISLEASEAESTEKRAGAVLSIVGNDRPGIVKDVAQVLAAKSVNVLELNTQFESAAMSAEPLFKTQAQIEIPTSVDFDEVKDSLENLSNDLMVEISKA